MIKGWRRWLWLGLGSLVLGLIIYNLARSPEWQNFRWHRFWASIAEARLGVLAVALLAVYATYAVRALRWRCFLDPIKRASLWVLFVGQILGFSSIYLVGRLGEFVRPAYIAKKENVPMSGMMAVLLLERVFDSVFLVLLFAVALYFAPASPATAHGASVLAAMHWGGHIMFALAGLMVVGLILYRKHATGLAAWVLRRFRFLPAPALGHLGHFLKSFAEGLSVIRDWAELLASTAWTVLLWVLNVTIFWLVFRSLGGELAQMSWLAAALTLFCAALGLVIQLPGIGGGYQLATIGALTMIFDISVERATGAGLLIWIMMSFPCLALGLVLLVREGLTIRKLEAIAEEERERAEKSEQASSDEPSGGPAGARAWTGVEPGPGGGIR